MNISALRNRLDFSKDGLELLMNRLMGAWEDLSLALTLTKNYCQSTNHKKCICNEVDAHIIRARKTLDDIIYGARNETIGQG